MCMGVCDLNGTILTGEWYFVLLIRSCVCGCGGRDIFTCNHACSNLIKS